MTRNIASINIRELGIPRSSKGGRKLDAEAGLSTLSGVVCEQCRGPLDFGTDRLGRSIETCRDCGYCPPSRSRTSPAIGDETRGGWSNSRSGSAARPRRAPDPDVADAAVQLLRATRAERAHAPMRPELVEARRAFDALLAREREARKGGRPRGPTLNLGRPGGVRRGPITILADGESLARPGPAAAVGPPVHRPSATPVPAQRSREPADLAPDLPFPPSTTPMPRTSRTFAPRVCAHCEDDFTPTGAAQRFCKPDCAAKAKAKATAKAEPSERPKRAIATGYRPPSASHDGGGYDEVIAAIEGKLGRLDAERDKLCAALGALRAIAAAE